MTLRIDADLLIPGRDEPVKQGTVILDGAKIAYAGPTQAAPSDVNTDVRVPVVMPGLWDCHIHFTGLAEPNYETWVTEPPARLAARATGDLHRALMGGVTSAREMGGIGIDIQPAIAAGQVSGPTVYGAGKILSTTGGHLDIHSVPLDALDSISYLGERCDGVPEVTRAVRLQLRKNASVIKICASGGVMSEVDHPIHQQFSDDELIAIVQEAARAERYVGAHCHGLPGIMAALRAGVMTIEHGSYLNQEAADIMVEQGAILVPTRFVIDLILQSEDKLPRFAYLKALIVADHHANALKVAVGTNVKIAMGTDIGISGDRFGQNSLEIRLLQDAGMTALEAIEAATATGPETLGPQAPLSGQLKEGYDADVIAIDFNPLLDNAGWGDPNRVTHVWQAGTSVKTPA